MRPPAARSSWRWARTPAPGPSGWTIKSAASRPASWADLAVISLPDRDEADPYKLLLDSDLPVLATMIDGEFIHNPGVPD